MPNSQGTTLISEKEYLESELARDIKHHLIDGQVYPVSGASANHARIAGNILAEFGAHLKNSTCEPLGSNMKIKVNSNFFYSDVMVVCDFDESQPIFTETPTIIVEVLSKTTRRIDETTKRFNYINIPTLQEYVLIEQDFVDIEVVRRSEGWQPKHYFLGDEVTFESIGLTLPVEEVYHRVKNQDMTEFLARMKNDK
ncbi:MAG: Uma2 family endonuclease [Phenylobacterium sp.]|jgi:Uma2 family endonuclease